MVGWNRLRTGQYFPGPDPCHSVTFVTSRRKVEIAARSYCLSSSPTPSPLYFPVSKPFQTPCFLSSLGWKLSFVPHLFSLHKKSKYAPVLLIYVLFVPRILFLLHCHYSMLSLRKQWQISHLQHPPVPSLMHFHCNIQPPNIIHSRWIWIYSYSYMKIKIELNSLPLKSTYDDGRFCTLQNPAVVKSFPHKNILQRFLWVDLAVSKFFGSITSVMSNPAFTNANPKEMDLWVPIVFVPRQRRNVWPVHLKC